MILEPEGIESGFQILSNQEFKEFIFSGSGASQNMSVVCSINSRKTNRVLPL